MRPSLLLVAAACACAVSALSIAAPKPASAAAPGRYSSRDQLRDCLEVGDALAQRREEMDRRSAEHEAALTQLQAEADKLVGLEAQLDRRSPTAITAWNLLVADQNARTKALNDEVPALSAAGEAFNADTLAANRRCAGNLYLADDVTAVLAERKRAGKRPDNVFSGLSKPKGAD
jgi:hypothetical protein